MAILTATVIACNESPTEITDQRVGVSDNEYIEALRSYPYTPDTTIVVDQEYLDNFLNCTTCIEPLPPPDDTAPYWSTKPNYVEKWHNGTLVSMELEDKTVDNMIIMPYPYVAVGAGARTGRNSFETFNLWGVRLNSQEVMEMNTFNNFQSNSEKLEKGHYYYDVNPSDEFGQMIPNVNYALIGISLRVWNGNVSKMWLYYAEYNNVTKEHTLTNPTSIKVAEVISGPEGNHHKEVQVRIFDANIPFWVMKKTFINGFGARTRFDNATKIGLLMVRY